MKRINYTDVLRSVGPERTFGGQTAWKGLRPEAISLLSLDSRYLFF